jgi:hypothetical protein
MTAIGVNTCPASNWVAPSTFGKMPSRRAAALEHTRPDCPVSEFGLDLDWRLQIRRSIEQDN